MEFTDFLIYKFVALVGIVFVVNFLHAAFTGRTIEQERRDREQAPQNSTDPESSEQPRRLK